MNLSFSMKIIRLVVCSVLFASGIGFWISSYFIQKGYAERGRPGLKTLTKSIQAMIDEMQTKLKE